MHLKGKLNGKFLGPAASNLYGPIRNIKNHGQKFTLRLFQTLAKRGPVTLMCHCAENEKRCHRHLLKAILLAKI